MAEPLLVTKFHIPPARADLVPHSQLLERLKAGLHGKLILISAPAGFGKTTLLSNLIAYSSLPCGWVSLDEDDNTPTRFLIYIIAALQKIDPHIGEHILPADLEALNRILSMVVETIPEIKSPIPAVTRDPKDDYLLAYALVGQADYLVTGDQDLLELHQVGQCQIITPRDFADGILT